MLLADSPHDKPSSAVQPPSSDLFSDEDVAYFEQLLFSKRREVIADARLTIGSDKIKFDSNELKDEFDLAAMAIEHEVTLKLLDRHRKLLREIERALERIRLGIYGYCEGTGRAIPRKRLEITPWVRHNVDYKERLEQLKRRNPLRYQKIYSH